MNLPAQRLEHIKQSLATALAEGYRIHAMPDGTHRVYLPADKAKQRGVDFYTVDLRDPTTPCNCRHGRFGKRCRHLGMVEGQELLTVHVNEAVHG